MIMARYRRVRSCSGSGIRMEPSLRRRRSRRALAQQRAEPARRQREPGGDPRCCAQERLAIERVADRGEPLAMEVPEAVVAAGEPGLGEKPAVVALADAPQLIELRRLEELPAV